MAKKIARVVSFPIAHCNLVFFSFCNFCEDAEGDGFLLFLLGVVVGVCSVKSL